MCEKGGKRVLTARSSRDGCYEVAFVLLRMFRCLMMINMFEKENKPTDFVLFFVYLYDFALYWFSFYRVIKALVSLIII